MRKLLFSCLLLSLYLIANGQAAYNYRYWFGGKENEQVVGASSEKSWNLLIDVGELNAGFHTIYFQVDSSGVQSSPIMRNFYKPVAGADEGLACICLIDGEECFTEKIPASGGILNKMLDVSSLTKGLHKMHVFAIAPSGGITAISESVFLRASLQKDVESMSCYYIIDSDSDNSYKQVGTYADGLFHFDLDVSSLNDGLHRLSYVLMGDNGVATQSNTSFFVKIPQGGNGIKRYEYWLNGNDSLKHVTELEQQLNPLQVVSLLPMDTCNIRSSCFEFRIEDETPVLYAKNDVDFRFYDMAGRVVETRRQYVDENVREEVPKEKIEWLVSGQVANVLRPSVNEIKWFKFDANAGDSISIKSDAACTVNVFSPTGVEVYAASGTASLDASVVCLPEKGTYYVAAHDVADASVNDFNLDFSLKELGYVSGDANGDNVVDAVDVVLVISMYLGEGVTLNFSAADVVKDGVLDSQDVVGIQNIYLK